ncbi:MAG: response regulator [Lachnospiraceae bacterium]|nr:response regulator [Lachnospiraceae bacterium]
MQNDTILIIDDDNISRTMLADIFRDEYKILEANNGKEGIELLRKKASSIAVVFLDYTMPVMNGFQVLELLNAKRLLTLIPFIMITSETSAEFEKKGYEYGVVSYVKKPFYPEVVKQLVKNVLNFFQYKHQLEITVKGQAAKLEKQNAVLRQQATQLRHMNEILVDALSNIVEFRDLESEQHIKRVRSFCMCLGTSVMKLYPEYELTPEKLEVIARASCLHDIGKIMISDSIILKSGKLTTDEFEIIKSHTTKGAEIIKQVIHLNDKVFCDYAYDIARHHHEKYNGKGYPDGLKGDEISIAAQIVSLIDVYDALTSKRVYKAAYNTDKAYQIIMNGQNGSFSPKLLKAFVEVRGEFENLVKKYKDDE